jgi:hypothetical protein
MVLFQFAPAAWADTWPTGTGAGTTSALETISRYGSSTQYSMDGVLAIGNAVYDGALTASVSWGTFGPPTGTLQGSSGGHTIGGTCTPSAAGLDSPTGLTPAEVDTLTCAAQIDAAETPSLTIVLSLVEDPPAGPCVAPASTCYYNYTGTFTAY